MANAEKRKNNRKTKQKSIKLEPEIVEIINKLHGHRFTAKLQKYINKK